MLEWLRQNMVALIVGSGGLGAAVRFIWGRQKKSAKRQAAIEEGLRGLLFVEMRREYRECKQKGYADLEDRNYFADLYSPYHTLGGNGTGTDMHTNIRKMPTEPPIEQPA